MTVWHKLHIVSGHFIHLINDQGCGKFNLINSNSFQFQFLSIPIPFFPIPSVQFQFRPYSFNSNSNYCALCNITISLKLSTLFSQTANSVQFQISVWVFDACVKHEWVKFSDLIGCWLSLALFFISLSSSLSLAFLSRWIDPPVYKGK